MQTGILGKNEELRRLWGGLLQEIVVQLNSGRGPEREEQLNKLLRDEMMPVPAALPSAGINIVKTTVIMIGGGWTTDQIVKAAKELPEGVRPGCINLAITQANMPSGNGRRRSVVIEWFEFPDHDPTTEEVRARCEESGYGYPQYEDGLRFQEDHPDDQRERSHIVIPENPWYDAYGSPRALGLWCAVDRKLDLNYCHLEYRWFRYCLFARRKY